MSQYLTEKCIFCDIISGKNFSRKIYEDNEILSFEEIKPIAPIHFLIIPKKHIQNLKYTKKNHQSLLGKMLFLSSKLAIQQGCFLKKNNGFRILINNGKDSGQEIEHLHLHVIGGKLLCGKI